MSQNNGALFINLGTPDDETPSSVGHYLKEFLMDPLVVDIPYVLRWILVNVLIVPRRKHKSAEAYKKIWNESGSPLLSNSKKLMEKMKLSLGTQWTCELGMRYGNPSVESALKKLKDQGVKNLTVVPLYPQYALSSTESSLQEVRRVLRTLNWNIQPRVITDFFDRSEFIQPLAMKLQDQLKLSEVDKVVFSFHGLPVRHLTKLGETYKDCHLKSACCDRVTADNRRCYRAQSYSTVRKVAARLGLTEDKYLVTFQSRLGRTEWIKPYTDLEIPKLAAQGNKRIAVVCPSFVADCLETLEEINIRAREDFMKAGGQKFTYIECLNADEAWVDGLTDLVRKPMAGI